MARKLAVRWHWKWGKGSKYQRAAEFISHWSLVKLKQKCAAFTRGVIEVLAKEETKLNREEFDKQIGTRTL